ncbi:MAG TPA: hypothetical protein VKR06_11895 [Ktedonosporobacter sp.]|nr:hypothetical protein [Ktedonosporobacter sp.]
MIAQFPVVLGVLRYEFRMQIRRPALWIVFAFMLSMFLLLNFSMPETRADVIRALSTRPLLKAFVGFTSDVNLYFPICVGILIADRLWRDRRTKVDELFWAMPAALSARITGKYLGSLLATLLPVLLFQCIGMGLFLYVRHDLMVIPLGLELFAVIILPGMLFISAFSLACPVIMPLPLYQFLFIGYWFWGNILWFHPVFLSLGRTLVSPIGVYAVQGFYGFDVTGSHAADSNLHATPLLGVASILVLVGIAIAVLFILIRLLKWRQAHM